METHLFVPGIDDVAPTFPTDTYCNFCGNTPGRSEGLNEVSGKRRICDDCMMLEIVYGRCCYYALGIT